MAFSVEPSLDNFLVRHMNYFKNVGIEGSFKDRIKVLQDKMTTGSNKKPKVVILGAGPAGLMRAIQSISNGNPTQVIEKRSENAEGRSNIVALKPESIAMLKYCGIYQYLINTNLIYPPNYEGYICVRLTDLEQAMKEVLKRLTPEQIIKYDSKVNDIIEAGNKIDLVIEATDQQKSKIPNVDILVNAEGSQSTTNNLLKITRKDVLPNIPVIAAFFQNPKVHNLSSFVGYTNKRIIQVAMTIYYHTLFCVKLICQKKFREQIKGAIILKTPKHNYVGCAFSDEVNVRLLSLKKRVDELKESNETIQNELTRAEREYNAYARDWINLSICAANIVGLITGFEHLIGRSNDYFYMGCNDTVDKFNIINIAADRADKYCGKYKQTQTAVLLVGDACATVDPTTGLGCNTAIQSSTAFLDFIWDYDKKTIDKSLKEYKMQIDKRVDEIHDASKRRRIAYRPDAVVVPSNA